LTKAYQSEVTSRLTSQLSNGLVVFFIIQYDSTKSQPALDPSPHELEIMNPSGSHAPPAETGAQTTSMTLQSNVLSSFADVVRRSVHSIAREITDDHRQEFVAAMYIEQDDKARRANSFVVSGLPVLSKKIRWESGQGILSK
jgi:hypothetical protein